MYISSLSSFPIALHLSQLAPKLLRDLASSSSNIWSSTESLQLWETYENIVVSCLQAGDEDSANMCLQKLSKRFGQDNERLMALTGMFKEAVAKNDEELMTILDEYDKILNQNPVNMPVMKRRIALLRSIGKPVEAINALIKLLESSPTDAEAWAELSDLYVLLGVYKKALFALEEVLLVTPFAWNIHARLGEILYMVALIDSDEVKLLQDSIARFCRSIELCDDYLRGYYGLKLVTDKLLNILMETTTRSRVGALQQSDRKKIERLNVMATSKLSDIIRTGSSDETGNLGYDAIELSAVKNLLSQDSDSSIIR
ncbi:BgTH12-02877 [Blumeria graminis f. sp. triticale]|uniref:ER membrane protein complex subunit 2 n=3 Tax=Blumeria graminis TaxID=34373 RepID=A0A381LI87_BLUGR|nr:hypothetical protein BGT96224_2992 [Blumeria graminis f. sp. tritici 96224]CAD6503209.1 BgTH12-02877 [Blumeria graminis f. sp. triticale]VDB89187.1 Bgt-2992 [Blumeria graminis f. sp. tritici]